MNKQCQKILDRLKEGKASNSELLRLSKAKNLTARISDLRRLGFNVKCVKKDKVRGLTWYELRSQGLPNTRVERTTVNCSMRLCKFSKKGLCNKTVINLRLRDGVPVCFEYVPVIRKKGKIL